MHRYLRPGLTAIIALMMAAVAWPLRPRPHGYVRPMADNWYTSASVEDQRPPIDASVDTAMFWVWMAGTAFMLLGAVVSIWWRSRPAVGRHRASF